MSRVSGTYIAHGPDYASMMQLTQAERGQVTGVVDVTQLRGDGRLHSDRTAIVGGAVDGGQLTLTVHSVLFGFNVAGTVGWNTIRFQGVGPDGTGQTFEFERSSASQFKTYTDELKAKADGISLSSNLGRQTQQLRELVQSSEKWIANAELHVRRISGVKDYYRKVENDMKALVDREHCTANSVARSQISVGVNQKDVDASQADIQVEQTWYFAIVNSGRAA
jgi:hypothetical protein